MFSGSMRNLKAQADFRRPHPDDAPTAFARLRWLRSRALKRPVNLDGAGAGDQLFLAAKRLFSQSARMVQIAPESK